MKIPHFGCFGAIFEDVKCFELILIFSVHILSMDGCFTVTLAPFRDEATNHRSFHSAIRQLRKHKSL